MKCVRSMEKTTGPGTAIFSVSTCASATAGIGIWPWACNDQGALPDVVMACCGDVPTLETLAESIEKADGFAQVFPEHKFHIVDVLQQRGHIVGMTGDGVNDVPTLKKADCDTASGRGPTAMIKT